jgi:hypothetical protein
MTLNNRQTVCTTDLQEVFALGGGAEAPFLLCTIIFVAFTQSSCGFRLSSPLVIAQISLGGFVPMTNRITIIEFTQSSLSDYESVGGCKTYYKQKLIQDDY